METLAIYAIILGGIVFSLMMTQIVLRLGSCGEAIKTMTAKHLFYSYAIGRHSLQVSTGPWTQTRSALRDKSISIAIYVFTVQGLCIYADD